MDIRHGIIRTAALWALSRLWGMTLDDDGNTVPRNRLVRWASKTAWRQALRLGVVQ